MELPEDLGRAQGRPRGLACPCTCKCDLRLMRALEVGTVLSPFIGEEMSLGEVK